MKNKGTKIYDFRDLQLVHGRRDSQCFVSKSNTFFPVPQ